MINQEWFKKLAFEGKLDKTFEGLGQHEGSEEKDTDPAAEILTACERDLDGKLNFSEYLWLRRAAIAWQMCASERMSRAGLKCGLSIVVQGRNLSQAEANTAFRVAVS
jgi:hypothetical protein